MKKPIIGLIPLWDEEKSSIWMLPGYLDGILRSGAIPVILPLTDDREVIGELAERYDGFLFTGGQDIAPEYYDEVAVPACGEICALRDRMEATLFRLVLDADTPALGICRGIQIFNVFLGGTLYQDIPAELPSGVCHYQKPPYDIPVHTVSLCGELRELLQADEIQVNSYHHQGIKAIAPGLSPVAKSPDGLIEAVVMPGKQFVWAVQWHPEYAPHQIGGQKLFSSFVGACR